MKVLMLLVYLVLGYTQVGLLARKLIKSQIRMYVIGHVHAQSCQSQKLYQSQNPAQLTFYWTQNVNTSSILFLILFFLFSVLAMGTVSSSSKVCLCIFVNENYDKEMWQHNRCSASDVFSICRQVQFGKINVILRNHRHAWC